MKNIIKTIEFDIIEWIQREKLAGEYNKFWSHDYKPENLTGLSLIDFALFYCAEHREDIDDALY